jgi:hypothetical protein
MKRLIIATSLVLACFGARAQGVMPGDTLQPRPSVDLLNVGVTKVKLKHNPADGNNVATVATGKATPRPPALKGRPDSQKAYYCDSGFTVKYHASPNCPGLEKCNAHIAATTLGNARRKMDGCRMCYH